MTAADIDPRRGHWRVARADDEARVVALSVRLYAEDPSDDAAPDSTTGRTFRALLNEPWRGRVLVLEGGGVPSGYAILVAFWSNELGGETCEIDELYVEPAQRGCGHASRLLEALARAPNDLWPGRPVALGLQVTPDNERARALYARHGFRDSKNRLMLRRRTSREGEEPAG